jgi:hypothetical protein
MLAREWSADRPGQPGPPTSRTRRRPTATPRKRGPSQTTNPRTRERPCPKQWAGTFVDPLARVQHQPTATGRGYRAARARAARDSRPYLAQAAEASTPRFRPIRAQVHPASRASITARARLSSAHSRRLMATLIATAGSSGPTSAGSGGPDLEDCSRRTAEPRAERVGAHGP